MNISLAKNDLISALQIVSKGLSTKPQTPILSGIYMTAKEGQLELQTTNYELGFILTIPAEIHNTGTAVLPGKYLTEFARKLPAEEVSIDTDSSDGLAVIQSGTARFTLRTMEISDFPILHRMDGTLHFTIKDRTLARLVKKSAFACLREEQRDRRPIFTGCQLEVEGKEVTFAATNVHRLAVKSEQLEEDAGQIRVIIPAKFLEEVTRTVSSEVPADIHVTCSYNQVSMSSGSIYMTARLIEGTFPDYRRVIPREENIRTKVTLDAASFASAVDRASLVAKGLIPAKRNAKIKILGDGDVTKKFSVTVDKISASAKEKIEKAGGSVQASVGQNRKERNIAYAKARDAKKEAAAKPSDDKKK